MALGKIEICNHALLKVGADTIASLDVSQATDDGVIFSAKLCNILFDQALVETLRLYPWNSATKRTQLTRLAEAPAFKYQFKYALPIDFVRVINLYASTEDLMILKGVNIRVTVSPDKGIVKEIISEEEALAEQRVVGVL